MIMQTFPELDFVGGVRADSNRAFVFSLLTVLEADPVRDVFYFHFLAELITVEEPKIEAAFVVRHKIELDGVEPFADWKF